MRARVCIFLLLLVFASASAQNRLVRAVLLANDDPIAHHDDIVQLLRDALAAAPPDHRAPVFIVAGDCCLRFGLVNAAAVISSPEEIAAAADSLTDEDLQAMRKAVEASPGALTTDDLVRILEPLFSRLSDRSRNLERLAQYQAARLYLRAAKADPTAVLPWSRVASLNKLRPRDRRLAIDRWRQLDPANALPLYFLANESRLEGNLTAMLEAVEKGNASPACVLPRFTFPSPYAVYPDAGLYRRLGIAGQPVPPIVQADVDHSLLLIGGLTSDVGTPSSYMYIMRKLTQIGDREATYVDAPTAQRHYLAANGMAVRLLLAEPTDPLVTLTALAFASPSLRLRELTTRYADAGSVAAIDDLISCIHRLKGRFGQVRRDHPFAHDSPDQQLLYFVGLDPSLGLPALYRQAIQTSDLPSHRLQPLPPEPRP